MGFSPPDWLEQEKPQAIHHFLSHQEVRTALHLPAYLPLHKLECSKATKHSPGLIPRESELVDRRKYFCALCWPLVDSEQWTEKP